MATGRPITADPAVGPDIDAPLVHPEVDGDDNHEVAAIDTAMHWLVDFATAEAIGMALRLQVDGPVDVLLVTGVRDGDPTAGADGLAALLDAQRFTAGLGIVDPGTLTNNTEGAPAGWSSAEPGSLGVVDACGRCGAHGAARPGTRPGRRPPAGRRRRRRRLHSSLP